MSVIGLFFLTWRDTNKIAKSQAVESAKAEERLLNMDFVQAKAKQLGNRREKAEVRSIWLNSKAQEKNRRWFLMILAYFILCQTSLMSWPAAHMPLWSFVILAGSACIQEHGQVHHPQGYCAALWGTISMVAHLPVIKEHHVGFKMWRVIFLSLQEVTALRQDLIPLKKKLQPYMDLSPVCMMPAIYHLTPNIKVFPCVLSQYGCNLKWDLFAK